jgi:(R,R)-butanediol dehydrogenase / meso-butanediol dehydrogenase / diacetyl reductase
MKAAVWQGRRDVRIERVSEPPAPPGQVQVKVSWCGICGTDLHEYLGGPPYIPLDRPHPLTGVQAPVIIGHELSGDVIAVGEGVQGFSVATALPPVRSSVAASVAGALQTPWHSAIVWHS